MAQMAQMTHIKQTRKKPKRTRKTKRTFSRSKRTTQKHKGGENTKFEIATLKSNAFKQIVELLNKKYAGKTNTNNNDIINEAKQIMKTNGMLLYKKNVTSKNIYSMNDVMNNVEDMLIGIKNAIKTPKKAINVADPDKEIIVKRIEVKNI